jgi:hypothetical protein
MKDHRPKPPPISAFIREFEFADSDRKIAIDRRAVAFCCGDRERENVVIVGFRSPAKAVPVKATYADIVAWWRGEPQPEPPKDEAPPKPNGTWKPPRPKRAGRKLSPAKQASRAAALAANKATEGA